ncbi:MAG: hypothetical protein IPN56_15935 [Chitinophagaceae bacterium]|nr:hypothetical protein [Chitinophagaceae bacterium]
MPTSVQAEPMMRYNKLIVSRSSPRYAGGNGVKRMNCHWTKGDWRKKSKEKNISKIHLTHDKNPLKGLAPLGCAYAKLGETEKALDSMSESKMKRERGEEEPESVLDIDLAMID